MELRLQANEAELLLSVLRIYLSDLRIEICRTDDYVMRQALKLDEETIKKLIDRLEQGTLVRS